MRTEPKRFAFFEPPVEVRPALDTNFIYTVLAVVGHEVERLTIQSWTPAERLVAYDYAIRVRMHVDARARDDISDVELRPCPSFVIAGDVHKGMHSFWLQLIAGETREVSA